MLVKLVESLTHLDHLITESDHLNVDIATLRSGLKNADPLLNAVSSFCVELNLIVDIFDKLDHPVFLLSG